MIKSKEVYLVSSSIFLMANLFLCLPANADTDSATNWKLIYQDNGLSLFEDTSRAVPSYKGEGVVSANLLELLANVSDI